MHAVALTNPGVTFSHESAAALLGLPVFGEPHDVHVLRDPAATSGSWAGLRTHTAGIPREIVDLGGLRVTSIAETAVDIARSRHWAIALAVIDAALRVDPALTVEELVGRNESRASSRGRRHARWPIHRGDPLAARPLESVSRAVIELLGFDAPELQAAFLIDGHRYFVDLYWRQVGVAGEADGLIKYDGRYGDPREALVAEKMREDRIRRMVTGFARWGWADVREPGRLLRILVAAGVPIAGIPHPEHLATLGAALNGHDRYRETGRAPRD